MIPVWPDKPVLAPNSKRSKFNEIYVFPSGRQALTQCLKHASLRRGDRVAIPEWSSHCVISAVGKIATPIPIQEVLRYRIKVSAVLLYDQWGWPTTSLELIEKITKITQCSVFIHDMVDSVPFNLNGNVLSIKEYSNKNEVIKKIYTIFSMSKTLGLCGGGLAFCNGKKLKFKKSQTIKFDLISQLEKSKDKEENILSFYKSEISLLPQELVGWLAANDVANAFELESVKRKKNLDDVVNSGLTKEWPEWMRLALNQGYLPCIVPLFKNKEEIFLQKKQNEIFTKHQIETSIYHFNWSNNTLEPNYEQCLAFPVHGMVKGIEKILNILMK